VELAEDITARVDEMAVNGMTLPRGFGHHEQGSVIIVTPNAENPKLPTYEIRKEWLAG